LQQQPTTGNSNMAAQTRSTYISGTTLCLKKDTTQPPTIISTVVVRFQQFMVRILLSKYAVEKVV